VARFLAPVWTASRLATFAGGSTITSVINRQFYATADVFFILPERRKGMVGYRLFAEAFKALPKPCKVLINEKLHFKDGRVGKLLERLGMKPIEVVYSKYISR
jgi:hypothetical protein